MGIIDIKTHLEHIYYEKKSFKKNKINGSRVLKLIILSTAEAVKCD